MKLETRSIILIVDDNVDNLKVLSDFLVASGFEVLIAKSGESALKKLQKLLPTLILLDVMMPGMNGFETCRQLKASPITKDIPVIFMTALTEQVDKVQGLEVGAVDYITKPIQVEEVLARINIHIKLYSLTQQLQQQNQLLQQEIGIRKQTEERLRLLESAIVNANDAVIIAQANPTHVPDSTIVYVNPAFTRITGYTSAEVMGKTLGTLHSDRADLAQIHQIADSLNQWQSIRVERLDFRKDGTEFWVESEIVPVADENGRFTHWVTVQRDITERKQSEAKLRENEERFRAMADSTTTMLWVSGTDGRCTFFNKTWLEFTGRTLQQELGTGWLEGVHPDDRQRCMENYLAAFRDRVPFELEYRLRRADGEYRWIVDPGKPWFAPDGSFAGYIGACLDITPRKQAAIEIASAKASLERVLQRSQLLEQITHNIRSTLNVQQIFQTAVHQIGQAFGVNRCCIHTYIAKPVPTIPVVAEYLEPGYPSMMGIEIPVVGNAPIKWVLLHDKALASHDVSRETLTPEVARIMQQMQTNSVLLVRTSYQGMPNGIICLQQCDRLREWTAKEIDLLEAVAAKVGIAIAQAKLLEQEKYRRLELKRQNLQLQAEIRERQRAESAFEESQRFIQAIADANPNMIYVYDLVECCNVYINRAVIGTLGYTPQQLQDLGTALVSTLMHPEDLAQLPGKRQKFAAAKDGDIIEFEYRMRHADGEWCWLNSWETVFTRTADGQPKQILGTATDISDRKQTEATLQHALEAAEVANRAKSQFLASMSHELRTPLNAVLGFSQLMARNNSLTSEQMEYLEIINRSGEHLLRLINDILEMSKIETGRTTLNENNFDLIYLLENLEKLLRLKAISKGLKLVVQCASDVPRFIKTDEGKLRQVLINLLGNAIKFTQKGWVMLRVKMGELESGKMMNINSSISLTSDSTLSSVNRLLFEIEDTGSGIAAHEIDLIFAAFRQTESGRKAQQGTGLGLAISRKYVQLMGGDIRVTSQLGQGSMFDFDIQITLADTTDIQTTQSQRRIICLAPDQPKYRILAVDDNPEGRLLLAKLLTSIGFEVKEAKNGREAVALWESWEPHLICMDMKMPVMDGYEATKQIKATLKGRETVIIALTASAFEEQRREILVAGCDDFAGKPFQEEFLLEKISQHLGVRYIYATANTPLEAQQQKTETTLSSDYLVHLFSQMPVEWLAKVNHAAAQGNDNLILKLLKQIPPENTALVNALAELADNLQFEKIIELTQQEG